MVLKVWFLGMEHIKRSFFTVFILGISFYSDTDAVCTWPSFIAEPSLWKDSDKESLFFKNSTHMEGWKFKIITAVTTDVNNWQCFSHNVTSYEGILILKATSSYSYFSGTQNLYRPYICMYLTKITDYSYQYYLKTDEQPYAGNFERVYIYEEINMNAADPTVSQLCSGTPQISEYHLLIRTGLESYAKLQCPDIFMGNYRYTFTNQSVTSCGTGTEYWNVCSDNQVMTFDYTKCSTEIAYSTLGSVYCVNNITDGTNTYVSVYNSDSSPTYQITCFSVTLSGIDSTTGSTNLSASQSPNSCTKTQTTTSVPITAQDVTLGAYMFLQAYIPKATSTTTTIPAITTTTTPTTTITTTTTPTTDTTATTTTTARPGLETSSIVALAVVAGVLVLLSVIPTISLIHKCKTPVEPEMPPPHSTPEVCTKCI